MFLCDCFFSPCLRWVERISFDKSIQMIVLMIMMKTTLWRYSFHFISFGWLFIYLSLPLVAFCHFFNLVNVILEMSIISHGFTQNGYEKKNKTKCHCMFFFLLCSIFQVFHIHTLIWTSCNTLKSIQAIRLLQSDAITVYLNANTLNLSLGNISSTTVTTTTPATTIFREKLCMENGWDDCSLNDTNLEKWKKRWFNRFSS